MCAGWRQQARNEDNGVSRRLSSWVSKRTNGLVARRVVSLPQDWELDAEAFLVKLEEFRKTFQSTYRRPMSGDVKHEFEAMMRMVQTLIDVREQAAD